MKRGGNLQRKAEMPRGKPLESRKPCGCGGRHDQLGGHRLSGPEMDAMAGLLKAARPRKQRVRKPAKGRTDTIPPKVRGLVNDRDPWCVHCGSPNALHQHHRRLKGDGGDTRPHTDCCCNLVRLCATCHYWAHVLGRPEAEAEGLIIPAETLLPGSVSVLVHTADGGMDRYPACDGEWVSNSPLAGAA